MSVSISAYIPCFNNAATIEAAIDSIRSQGVASTELIVVDDGSTDNSVALARAKGVDVRTNPGNMGRGYTRAYAMRESRGELVLGLDATKTLAPGFVNRAVSWLNDAKVAAVYGRCSRRTKRGAVERWESRHVFREHEPGRVNHRADLFTGGVVMRRSAVLELGNFNETLRHSEDADMGRRLLQAGLDVVYDPDLVIYHRLPARFWNLMERYWRWNVGLENKVSFLTYLRMISYSIKVLARRDLGENDVACVPVSLFVPHYQFWRSLCLKMRGPQK